MVNDTISDLLTRIRNANNAKHRLVEVPLTKMTSGIVQILKEEGDYFKVPNFYCVEGHRPYPLEGTVLPIVKRKILVDGKIDIS